MTIKQHPYIIEASIRDDIRQGRASLWQVLGWIVAGKLTVRRWLRCRRQAARIRKLRAAQLAAVQGRIARLEVRRVGYERDREVELAHVVRLQLVAARRDLAELEKR